MLSLPPNKKIKRILKNHDSNLDSNDKSEKSEREANQTLNPK